MKLSQITWRYNDREKKKKKKIHSLSRRERWGLNFRGVQFKVFCCRFFFPEWASFAFFCLYFALLYKESNVSLVLQGSLKQAFWNSGGFLVCFLLFTPLKFGKWPLNRGYWLEVLNPKRIGWRWNTETCCSSKKKILMALNCLNISKSFMVWGEKRGNSPHSTFFSRGGFWKYNQQKTTNFLVYL